MKKLIYATCIFLITLSVPLIAKIIEVDHFHDLVEHVESDTLVILDIDDTLLIPVQTLGTDVWFCHRFEQLRSQYDSRSQALDMALAEWQAVRHITQVKIVEGGTDEIINSLQKMNVPIMGLTTQELTLTACTINQLGTLNIDLLKTAPSMDHHYFINQQGVLYRNGILFTSGTQKGPALIKLLDTIGYRPKKIVFINDKATHLKDVENSVLSNGMDFVGLRYNYSDERVKNFRKDIADIQWKNSTFHKIMSDEEAEELLRSRRAYE